MKRNRFFVWLEKILPQNKAYGHAVATGKGRVLLIGTVIYCVFFIVGIKVIHVTVFPESAYVSSVNTHVPIKTQTRAPIFDRNGVLVATMLKTKGLYVNPQRVRNPSKLTNNLRKILPNVPYAKLYKKVTYKKARFVWLNRRLTPKQQYRVNALGNVAVDFIDAQTRVYPQGSLLANVIGYVNVDNKGMGGLEQALDARVSSTQKPVFLTIDTRVQYILHSELQDAITATSAIGGTGIVLDVNTGEVLSMVSLPNFDPNHAGNFPNRFNRATLGVYELGSTFKILNSAMVLDTGKVTMTDVFDTTKPLHVGGFTIRDYHGKYRPLSVPEIFIYSSNIGSAKMAYVAGTEAQKAFMKKMGLLSKLDIPLPETGYPLYPKHWRKTETTTIAYGHGIAITPLHLVASIAALINGGIYYTPKFLRENTATGRRVIRKKTSDNIRKLMRLNTLKGSGGNANAKGYVVGGKTGTADKPKSGGYDTKSLISSYVAAFPMQSPKYLVYILLDTPQPGKYTHGFRPTGGWVAAPAVKKIITRIAPLLGIAPVDENSDAIKKAFDIPKPKKTIFGKNI